MERFNHKIPFLHHELPYRYFDPENEIFINEHDGAFWDKVKGNMGTRVGYGFGLEISPLSGSSPSVPEVLNELICKKLPVGKQWGYQFVLTADRKLSDMIETNRKIHAQGGGMYAKLAQYQADMANKALTDGFNNGFGKGARFDLKNYRSFFFANTTEDNLDKLLEVKAESDNDFSSLGTSFRAMGVEDFIDYISRMVNHNPRNNKLTTVSYNPHDTLNLQVYDATTEINAVTAKYIDINFHDDQTDGLFHPNKTRVVCLTLKKLPTEIYHWHLQKYLSSFKAMGASLACPFMWSLNFQIEDKATSEHRVNSKIAGLRRMRGGTLGNLMAFLDDELAENEEAQRGLAGDVYRLCNFSVDLILFTDEKNWSRDSARAMNLFRDGLELMNPQKMQMQTFLSCLPFMYTRLSDDRSRAGTRHKAKSSNLANMAPIVGDYKGGFDNRPKSSHQGLSYGVLTPTRCNQAAFFNPFIMGTDSYNMIVAGGQGSGKSVFVQLLIKSLLCRGGLAFAIDKGGSYSKLCRSTGNKIINAATLHLNPFSHLDYEAMKRDPDLINDPDISVEALLANSLSMITELYAMIGRPREGVSDFEKNFLNGCITRAYHKKQTKTLVDDVVFEMEAEIAEDKANGAPFDRRKYDWAKEYLKTYMTTGSAPDVFNKPSLLDPKANFICIETEGVPANLKNPVIMALTIDIDNRIILSESAREKMFVIEEVAAILKHLKSDALIEKIEEGAATYRKKGASIVGVSQAVEEFFDTPLLRILYIKAALKIIMLQGAGFAHFAKEKKLFNDAEIAQIARFKPSSEARFSSFLLKSDEEASSLHHVYLDPYTKVLTSTRNQETAAIKAYRKQGFPQDEAVEKVMWDFYGDEARALEAWREQRAQQTKNGY